MKFPRAATLFFVLSSFNPFLHGEQIPVTSSVPLPSQFVSDDDESPQVWRYLLHLPEGYEDSPEPWPMIFYLHGRSLRGDDLARVKRYGPPALLDRKPDFPFVVVSPQLPDHSWPANSLVKLVDEVIEKYRVDSDRVYLTGVSMGGGGSWSLAAAGPDRFAAFAPLCGFRGTHIAPKLCRLPIWAFHGTEDDLVPIEPHAELVAAVNDAGGNAHLSAIPHGDHGNIIFPVYRTESLYRWFLSHRRGADSGSSEFRDLRKSTRIEIPKSRWPKPKPEETEPEDAGSNPPQEKEGGVIHQVEKGDTLWGIGKRYDVTVDELKSANSLSSDVIRVGQRLAIPR